MSEWHICMCDISLSLVPYTFGHLLHENVGWSEWFLCIWSWSWASVMHLYSQNRHANLLLLHLSKYCSKLDFDENDFSHNQHLCGASHVSKCIFRFFSVRKTRWHRWHWSISGFFFLWSGMCFCIALNVLNVQLHSPHITWDIPIHALSCSSWLCSFLNILPQFFLYGRSKGDFSIYFSHLCTVKFHQLVIRWLHPHTDKQSYELYAPVLPPTT